VINNLEFLIEIVHDAYLYSKTYLDNPSIISSVEKDIKTELDYNLNKFITERLSYSGLDIISEEAENNNLDTLKEKVWIIDPLDGTFNLSIKFPYSSISVALFDKSEPIIGVIKDIINGVTYSSEIGKGAWKMGKEIHVSQTKQINSAVLATGFPSGGNFDSNDMLKFVECVQKFKKIRAIGSASQMLAYVAEGVFDVYYEKDIYIWDVAAGLSLVREAGGEILVKSCDGSFKCEVLASNKLLFSEAKKILIYG
jgi:myo-inositol-1(or 4)-monophosphatase